MYTKGGMTQSIIKLCKDQVGKYQPSAAEPEFIQNSARRQTKLLLPFNISKHAYVNYSHTYTQVYVHRGPKLSNHPKQQIKHNT